METVRIAQLKARLSQYLRRVRQGHPVVVFERDTPIARIVPYEKDPQTLVVRKRLREAPRIGDVSLPPPLKLKIDILELLLQERQPKR